MTILDTLHTVHIAGEECSLDKLAILAIMEALSEQHGRLCKHIAECGCMDGTTNAAEHLEGINNAFTELLEVVPECA